MIRNRQTAEHYRWGQVCDGWRLVDRPDLSVIQERIPPGGGEVRHLHERARQVFLVLHGHLQIELDGHLVDLAPGDALEVAPRQIHLVRNASTADVSFVVISTPSTRADRRDVRPEGPNGSDEGSERPSRGSPDSGRHT
jgi:mannose-6-phosphate isomerase-like protein (cupin superfamily)